MSSPEYVFEILDNDPVFPGCVGIRRADLQNLEAREALVLLMQSQFQIGIDLVALDECLKRVPPEWPFLKAAPPPKWIPLIGPPLLVAQMEREPGKDKGENPVITNLQQITNRQRLITH